MEGSLAGRKKSTQRGTGGCQRKNLLGKSQHFGGLSPQKRWATQGGRPRQFVTEQLLCQPRASVIKKNLTKPSIGRGRQGRVLFQNRNVGRESQSIPFRGSLSDEKRKKRKRTLLLWPDGVEKRNPMGGGEGNSATTERRDEALPSTERGKKSSVKGGDCNGYGRKNGRVNLTTT